MEGSQADRYAGRQADIYCVCYIVLHLLCVMCVCFDFELNHIVLQH